MRRNEDCAVPGAVVVTQPSRLREEAVDATAGTHMELGRIDHFRTVTTRCRRAGRSSFRLIRDIGLASGCMDWGGGVVWCGVDGTQHERSKESRGQDTDGTSQV